MIGYIEQLGACFSESDDEVKGKERPDVQTEAERAFVGAGDQATPLSYFFPHCCHCIFQCAHISKLAD